MDSKLRFTKRELAEIGMALFYVEKLGHGTDGHGRLKVIAKFAIAAGFRLSGNPDDNYGLILPDTVEVGEDRIEKLVNWNS